MLRRPSARAWIVAIALLLLASGRASAEPSLVIVGGEFKDQAIFDEAVRLAGGPAKARVGILTLGSAPSKAEENGRYYIGKFRRSGAAEVTWLSIDADRPQLAEDPVLAAKAAGLNVIVLGGGSQLHYTDVLLRADGSDTALLAAIRRGAGATGVIAGTSAGAAALVEGPMITGGESADALLHSHRVTDRRQGGLGFFRWGLIDTHFAERGRQGRLIRLASRRKQPLAFGVDENTALVVTGGAGARAPRFRVVGRGGVSVFDLTGAKRPARGPWQLTGVRAHYLTRGDGFDPRTRRARIGAGKVRDSARIASRATDRADVFGAHDPATRSRPHARAFVRAAMAAMTPGAPAVVTHPAEHGGWRVTLRRGRGASRSRTTGTARAQRSYRNLRVDLHAPPAPRR